MTLCGMFSGCAEAGSAGKACIKPKVRWENNRGQVFVLDHRMV